MYEKELDREIKNLDKRGLPIKAVKTIKQFNEDLRMGSKPISAGRRYAYVIRLRKIAKMIPKKFLNPSERDLKLVMDEIKNTDVKWGSGPPHKPTEKTMQGYFMTLKKFYKWYLGKGKTYPECVEWIKLGDPHPSKEIEPESLISLEEVNKLIEACENPRDRAIFSTLYDSGVRLGELLHMKVNSVNFDKYGAILRVPQGKTGFRQVRVIGNSIPYLNQWLSVHPNRGKGEAPLFCNLSEGIRGRAMTPHDVYTMIKKVKKRAGITRRIYPHLYRHSYATRMASRVTEAPLEAQLGWVHGSDQTRTYVHLSMRDQDRAVLKGLGVQVEEEGTELKDDRFKTCPRCHQETPGNSLYCVVCGLPMDVKTAVDYDEKVKQIEDTIMNSSVIPPEMKEFINSFKPEDRDKAYTATLKWIEENAQREERLVEETVERILARRTNSKGES